MSDGLTLGQLEAIGAEVWGPTTEIHARSERLIYVVLALAGRDVSEWLTPDEVERIREARNRLTPLAFLTPERTDGRDRDDPFAQPTEMEGAEPT